MSEETQARQAEVSNAVRVETRLSKIIRAAEERGYRLELHMRPNTCPHGPPCCEACKALPENQHSITVIG